MLRNDSRADKQYGKTWIGIKASDVTKCVPSQYVPQDWCFSQFYNVSLQTSQTLPIEASQADLARLQMCKNGDKKGNKNKTYGKNGCQGWQIMAW